MLCVDPIDPLTIDRLSILENESTHTVRERLTLDFASKLKSKRYASVFEFTFVLKSKVIFGVNVGLIDSNHVLMLGDL